MSDPWTSVSIADRQARPSRHSRRRAAVWVVFVQLLAIALVPLFLQAVIDLTALDASWLLVVVFPAALLAVATALLLPRLGRPSHRVAYREAWAEHVHRHLTTTVADLAVRADVSPVQLRRRVAVASHGW